MAVHCDVIARFSDGCATLKYRTHPESEEDVLVTRVLTLSVRKMSPWPAYSP